MNNVSLKITLLASLLAMFAAACSDDADTLTNGKGKRKGGTKAAGSSCTTDTECESGTCDTEAKVCTAPNTVTEALMCNAKPAGARSYKLFDGSRLEDSRMNEGSGVNRARIKPYAVMASEFQRVLGNTPEGIKTAGPSFNAAPARWFGEPVYSGVSINKAFDISFEGCLTYVPTDANMKGTPDADTAKTACTALMRKAWSHSPSPEEVDACSDLAVNKLSTETDTTRRWAYVCASILSSSQFLTY